MQITFQRMRKNFLRQDNDWNELLNIMSEPLLCNLEKK